MIYHRATQKLPWMLDRITYYALPSPRISQPYSEIRLGIPRMEEFQSRLARRLASSPAWHDKISERLGKQPNPIPKGQTLAEEWIISQVAEAWKWKDDVRYVSIVYRRQIHIYVDQCPIHLFDRELGRLISRDTLALHIEALLREPHQLWKRVLASPTRQLLDALYHDDSLFDPRESQIDEFLEIDDSDSGGVPQFECIPYISLSSKFTGWFRGLLDKIFNLSDHALQTVIQTLGRYAILSHRWDSDDQELTFDSMEYVDQEELGVSQGGGYTKFRGFCDAAAFYGCRYVWIDSGCINRSDKAELDVSISSMYQWYSKAYVTIIYLSETIEDDQNTFYYPFQDPWWRRGWTLQEFVASRRKRYFYRNWKAIDDQDWDYDARLFVDKDGSHGGFLTRVFQSMQSRQTKLSEDMAYCLHSLLNVNPPIRYGEGFERALYRLQVEYVTGGDQISEYPSGSSPSQYSKYRLLRWSGKRSRWNSMFASDFKAFNVKRAQLKYHNLRGRFNTVPSIFISTDKDGDILSIEMYLYPIHRDATSGQVRVNGKTEIDLLLDDGVDEREISAGWVLGVMREDPRYVFGVILRQISDDGSPLYERVGIMVSGSGTSKEWSERDVLSVLWRECSQPQLVHVA